MMIVINRLHWVWFLMCLIRTVFCGRLSNSMECASIICVLTLVYLLLSVMMVYVQMMIVDDDNNNNNNNP